METLRFVEVGGTIFKLLQIFRCLQQRTFSDPSRNPLRKRSISAARSEGFPDITGTVNLGGDPELLETTHPTIREEKADSPFGQTGQRWETPLAAKTVQASLVVSMPDCNSRRYRSHNPNQMILGPWTLLSSPTLRISRQ